MHAATSCISADCLAAILWPPQANTTSTALKNYWVSWTPQFNIKCLNLYLIIMKYFTKNKPGTSFFTLIDGEDGIMVSSSESSSESPSSSASCHSTLGPRWKRRRVPRCKTGQFLMMRNKICECKCLVQYWCSDTWGQAIFTNECNSSLSWWRVFKDSKQKINVSTSTASA